MLATLEKLVAQACVNASETGSALGRYGAVAVIPGDDGHLTYGRSQTTLASGGLHKLIAAYCTADGAQYGDALKPYLGRLEKKDLSLDRDATLKTLLELAGDDPVMRATQDSYFDALYWEPAVRAAGELGLELPLSVAVVYDSHIHGSWGRIRDRVIGKRGRPGAPDPEKTWVVFYLQVRRAWFEQHSNKVLRRATVRMDAFLELASTGNWRLELPFTFRGVRIDAASLELGAGTPAPVAPAPKKVVEKVVETSPAAPEPVAPESRLLRLTDPPMEGEDVAALQLALAEQGFALDADASFGVFEAQTDLHVREFQKLEGLDVDGIVGPLTHAALNMNATDDDDSDEAVNCDDDEEVVE